MTFDQLAYILQTNKNIEIVGRKSFHKQNPLDNYIVNFIVLCYENMYLQFVDL